MTLNAKASRSKSRLVAKFREQMKLRGITIAELARKAGTSRSAVHRVLDPEGDVAWHLLERCGRVLGLHIMLLPKEDVATTALEGEWNT